MLLNPEWKPCLIRRMVALTLLVGSAVSVPASAADPVTSADLPTDRPPGIGTGFFAFQLTDFYGQPHKLDDYRDHRMLVVVFFGTECPLAKLYGPRLASLAEEYASRGVAFVGINANRQDALTEIAAYARRHGIDFPLLKDTTGEVAEQFGATRTPEVFLLDDARQLQYQGRIDDQYGVGYGRSEPEREDLRRAIDALLAGRMVERPRTQAVGCLIGRPRKPDESSEVTYSRQISRVLRKHCVECHRAGEIAPFTLETYDEAVGWAEMIEEVVRTQRMPPWSANPQHGEFANARSMSEEEKELIYGWVEAGAPEGDPAELPEPREFVTGWRLPREPDVVIPMRETPFEVPAEGIVEYQYFAVDPGFEEDRWIAASDIVPGERSVVHHVIVFISPPQGRDRRGLGWLAAYVPGQSSMQLPPGQARLVPAGSKLIFQLHYTPNGSVQHDLTRIGLVFAEPESVEEEVVTLLALEEKFEIPPGAENHRVSTTRSEWPFSARLLAMSPHMHVRGKSFRFDALWPDGHRETLLDIPDYDFNWQNSYQLAEPFDIPTGFAVECVAHFDNSRKNIVNPDPEATVRWGDQTADEMMIGFFEVAVPKGAWRSRLLAEAPGHAEADQARARQVVKRLFDRFDANQDAAIDRDELPSTFRVFAFRRYDRNGDRVITQEEAYQFALASGGDS